MVYFSHKKIIILQVASFGWAGLNAIYIIYCFCVWKLVRKRDNLGSAPRSPELFKLCRCVWTRTTAVVKLY